MDFPPFKLQALTHGMIEEEEEISLQMMESLVLATTL